LAVGANGTVLTADSAESTGLKWATPASGTFPVLTRGGATSSFSTSSTSFVDVTGMSITRTPISGTNKIELKADMVIYSTAQWLRFRFVAGATNLNIIQTTIAGAGYHNVVIVYCVENVAASSTVFKVQCHTEAGTGITIEGTNSGYHNLLTTLEVY